MHIEAHKNENGDLHVTIGDVVVVSCDARWMDSKQAEHYNSAWKDDLRSRAINAVNDFRYENPERLEALTDEDWKAFDEAVDNAKVTDGIIPKIGSEAPTAREIDAAPEEVVAEAEAESAASMPESAPEPVPDTGDGG